MSETKSDSMWIMLCYIRDYLKEDVTSQLKALEARQISFNEWFHREWVALKKQKPELHDQSDDLLSFSIKIEAMLKDNALFLKRLSDLSDRIHQQEIANHSLRQEIATIRETIHIIHERICSLEQKQNRGFFARLFNLGS